MFERFTDRARVVIVDAEAEARNLEHGFIGPEHLLVGLSQGNGIAARVLRELGVSHEELRAKVSEAIEPKTNRRARPTILSKPPFSPSAKKCLEHSLREALRLGHNYIGTEHILLGVLDVVDEDRIVRFVGVPRQQIRQTALDLLGTVKVPTSERSPAVAEALKQARQIATSGPMTTGLLLLALLADDDSHAGKALAALGVTAESAEQALAQIAVQTTSDAPAPQLIEIRLGGTTTTIGDPDLAARLASRSPEELRAALWEALGGRTGTTEAESA